MHSKVAKTFLYLLIAGCLTIGFFVLINHATRAATGIPSIINYQGKLLDSNGAAVADGT